MTRRMIDLDVTESVRYEPCESFRLRLSGDLFTCAKCGWWSSEHYDDSERSI